MGGNDISDKKSDSNWMKWLIPLNVLLIGFCYNNFDKKMTCEADVNKAQSVLKATKHQVLTSQVEVDSNNLIITYFTKEVIKSESDSVDMLTRAIDSIQSRLNQAIKTGKDINAQLVKMRQRKQELEAAVEKNNQELEVLGFTAGTINNDVRMAKIGLDEAKRHLQQKEIGYENAKRACEGQ